MKSLVTLLDSSDAAHRPTAALPVWYADGRVTFGRLVRREALADTYNLLEDVLGTLFASDRTLFLAADPDDVEVHQLGPGDWQRTSHTTWAIPPDAEAHFFVREGLGHIGGYVVYERATSIDPNDLILPWGRSKTWPAEFLAALERLQIPLAVSVAPDSTEWVVGIAAQSA